MAKKYALYRIKNDPIALNMIIMIKSKTNTFAVSKNVRLYYVNGFIF